MLIRFVLLPRIPSVPDSVGNVLTDAHVAVTTNQRSAEELGRSKSIGNKLSNFVYAIAKNLM